MPPISTMESHEQHPTLSMQPAPAAYVSNNDIVSNETGHPAGPCVPLLVVMVGSPASGKSAMAHRISRRLNWLGHKTTIITSDIDIEREPTYAHEATSRLQEDFSVVIMDGCNGKLSTRRHYQTKCSLIGARLLYVKLSCSNPNIINANMLETVNFNRDHKTIEEALGELRRAIDEYADIFEPITHEEGKLIEVQMSNEEHEVVARNITGYREMEILSIVSCRMPKQRTYYFTRHGESEYNVLGRIGGDAGLSARGRRYAERLAQYATGLVGGLAAVWTSLLRRTVCTASGVPAAQHRLRALNEIDAGICEGMTYEEIQEKYPQEFAWRDQDKLNYRYPWGESYADIIARITPVLEDLESTTDVLVVSHQAVLRVVLGYFLDVDKSKLPYESVPLHTVIKVTSHGYDYRADFLPLNVDCVDTNRKQPKNCTVNRTNDDALNTVPNHFDTLQVWNASAQMV